jgi:hypothetical protein
MEKTAAFELGERPLAFAGPPDDGLAAARSVPEDHISI